MSAASVLGEARIPTIPSGARGGRLPQGQLGLLRRLGVYPTSLIFVVALAFVVSQFVGDSSEEPSYTELVERIEQDPDSISSVTLRSDPNEIEVNASDGEELTIGYPPSEEEPLVRQLRRAGIDTSVEGGGGQLARLVAAVDASSPDAAKSDVRQRLPSGGEWQVGPARPWR